jgi:hypothetical protein
MLQALQEKNKHDCSECYRHYNKKTNMTARNGTGTTVKQTNMTALNGTGTTVKKQT